MFTGVRLLALTSRCLNQTYNNYARCISQYGRCNMFTILDDRKSSPHELQFVRNYAKSKDKKKDKGLYKTSLNTIDLV